jgi:hypothetical protein
MATILTEEQVAEIRRKHKGGKSVEGLASGYGVTRVNIHKIINGETWVDEENAPTKGLIFNNYPDVIKIKLGIPLDNMKLKAEGDLWVMRQVPQVPHTGRRSNLGSSMGTNLSFKVLSSRNSGRNYE